MDPVTIATIGSLAGGALGGIFRSKAGSKERKAEEEALQKYIQSIQNQQGIDPNLFVPEYEQIDANQLQAPTYQEETATFQQGDTNLGNISTDPALRAAQMNVLARLGQIEEQGGMTLADQANLQNVMGQVRTAERGAQEANLQSMARRGMLGSGAELGARMANTQAAYDQAATQGLNVAAQAQNRALQAALQKANTAAGMESADYQKAANTAQARDAIQRFNLQNSQGAYQRNLGLRNQSSTNKANLQNQAYLGNINTQNKSAEAKTQGNLAAQQQQINQPIAAAQAGYMGAQSKNKNAQAKADAQAGLIGNLATGAGLGAGYIWGK